MIGGSTPMFRRLDDLLFERVFEPFCDVAIVRWGRDNWWLSTQSLTGSVAVYLVALTSMILFYRETLSAASFLNVFPALMGFRRSFVELREARDQGNRAKECVTMG
jgi:hypothetical protein